MKQREEEKGKINIPRSAQPFLARLLGSMAGLSSGLNNRHDIPKSDHWCVKCDRLMNQASKHCWKCPVCGKIEDCKGEKK